MHHSQVVGWSVHSDSGILGPLYIDVKGNIFFLDISTGVFVKVNLSKMNICLDHFLDK